VTKNKNYSNGQFAMYPAYVRVAIIRNGGVDDVINRDMSV